MVGAGFVQSLWEKPIWEGVWPYLDPMDSVPYAQRHGVECARKVGELFFFLIQKDPAMVPGSETFSPFLNADIRTPLFNR